jgi:hypothetical protein
MKSKLRMATVFTGAAACAAAFGPTAAAATTAATAGKPLPANTEVTAGKLLPSIDEVDCNASEVHWFHLYWLPSADHGPTCLGYKGTKTVDHSFEGWCPGTNWGWFTAVSYYGTEYTSYFSPFFGYIPGPYSLPFYVLDVHISSWSGNAVCSI